MPQWPWASWPGCGCCGEQQPGCSPDPCAASPPTGYARVFITGVENDTCADCECSGELEYEIKANVPGAETFCQFEAALAAGASWACNPLRQITMIYDCVDQVMRLLIFDALTSVFFNQFLQDLVYTQANVVASYTALYTDMDFTNGATNTFELFENYSGCELPATATVVMSATQMGMCYPCTLSEPVAFEVTISGVSVLSICDNAAPLNDTFCLPASVKISGTCRWSISMIIPGISCESGLHTLGIDLRLGGVYPPTSHYPFAIAVVVLQFNADTVRYVCPLDDVQCGSSTVLTKSCHFGAGNEVVFSWPDTITITEVASCT